MQQLWEMFQPKVDTAPVPLPWLLRLTPKACFAMLCPGAQHLSKLSAAASIQGQIGPDPSQVLVDENHQWDMDSLEGSTTDGPPAARGSSPVASVVVSHAVVLEVAASLARRAIASRLGHLVDGQRFCDGSFADAVDRLLAGINGGGCGPMTLAVATARLAAGGGDAEAAGEGGKPIADAARDGSSSTTPPGVDAAAPPHTPCSAEGRYRLWCRCIGVKCQRTVAKILAAHWQHPATGPAAADVLRADGETLLRAAAGMPPGTPPVLPPTYNPAAAAAAADPPGSLDLSSVRLGKAGVVPLLLALRDAPCDRLWRLRLTGCALDDDAVTALLLVAEAALPNLRHVDLSGNEQVQFRGGVAVQRFVARRLQHSRPAARSLVAADDGMWIGLAGTSVRPSTLRSIEKLCQQS